MRKEGGWRISPSLKNIYKKLMTTQEASKLTELMTGVVGELLNWIGTFQEVIRLQERQEQQNTEMPAAPHRTHGLLDFPMWKTRIL